MIYCYKQAAPDGALFLVNYLRIKISEIISSELKDIKICLEPTEDYFLFNEGNDRLPFTVY